MARDVDIAKALATDIAGQTFSKPFNCEFKYDLFVNSENVDDTQVRVALGGDNRQRQSRSAWHRDAAISVAVIAPQQSNNTLDVDAEAEITALLDFWDEILDFIETSKPAGRQAITISSFDGERFDIEKLHNDRQFRAGVSITYQLI